MRRPLSAVLCLVVAVGYPSLCYADTIQIDTGTTFDLFVNLDNYMPYDACLGGITDGGTLLLELAYLPLNNDHSSDILGALYTQYGLDTSNPDYTLIYNYSVSSQSLTGDMLIDLYEAYDRESGVYCLHGANIAAYYDYGPGEENLGLDWVQIYDESGGSVHSPYDYTVDGTGDQSPGYYAPGQIPWTPPNYTLLTGYDETWTDGPRDPHNEASAWSGSVEFYMFLASFGDMYPDPSSRSVFYRDVVIYDGIVWGYEGECVPEPTTLAVLCLGLAGVALKKMAGGY